ncbi:MAG: hypothetical protein BZ136_01605 [Methanosphaera sp. rholeuAM74]|nr:MAG: hypothetical protein BZ136_01605 [Methanosphaera sp. rholeuAM74]
MKSNQNVVDTTETIIKTRINPTESRKKVIRSITNIITRNHEITITDNDDVIINSDITVIDTLSKKIKKEEIEQVAYNILTKNRKDDTTKLYINKQAAYNNTFHIIDENISPLTDIEVTIKSDDIDAVIDYMLY